MLKWSIRTVAKLKVTVQTLLTYCDSISRRRRGRVLGHPVFHFHSRMARGAGLGKPEQMADGEYLRTILAARKRTNKAFFCFVDLRPGKWERLGVGKY